MLQLVVDNGLIKRTRRRKPELRLIEGNPALIVLAETVQSLKNLEDAFSQLIGSHDDAREIAEKLLAMYETERKRR